MRLWLGVVLAVILPVAACTATVSTAEAAVPQVSLVPSVVETTPVLSAGDAADDPAIWVHPSNPSLSVVIGNDKMAALETYDLGGQRLERLTNPTGYFGNVDVRQGVVIAGAAPVDIIAAGGGGIRVYTMDAGSR